MGIKCERAMRSDELCHHGIKGMKWGVRRFQKSDGSLTSAGKQRYDSTKSDYKSANKKSYKAEKKAYKQTDEYKAERAAKTKKALKVGAAVAGTALAAYGAYKLSKAIKNKNIEIATQKGEALAKEYIRDNKWTVTSYSNLVGLPTVSLQRGSNKPYTVFASTGDMRNVTSGTMGKEDLKTLAKFYGEANNKTIKRAQGIKTSTIKDAYNDKLGTATKNVASYYVNKAKTNHAERVEAREVGRRVRASIKEAEGKAKRLAQEEYLARAIREVEKRNHIRR